MDFKSGRAHYIRGTAEHPWDRGVLISSLFHEHDAADMNSICALRNHATALLDVDRCAGVSCGSCRSGVLG
jgi:hypothetical protein